MKKLISKRDININLFLLDNGNGLLESTMLDPYHLIRLEVEIQPSTRTIVNAISQMQIHPYEACKAVEDRAKSLIGLKIEKGVMKSLTQAVGGSSGCVHLRELASETINFAATALTGFEAGFGLMDPGFNRKPATEKMAATKNLLKNSCFPYKE